MTQAGFDLVNSRARDFILAAGTPLIRSAHSGVYLVKWALRADTFWSVLALGPSVALMNLKNSL